MRPSNYRLRTVGGRLTAVDRYTGRRLGAKELYKYFVPHFQKKEGYSVPEDNWDRLSLFERSELWGSYMRSNGRVSER